MCTHVGIIERGRLLVSGHVGEILQRLQPTRSLLVRVLGRGAQALALIQHMPGVQEATWIAPAGVPANPGAGPGPAAAPPDGPLLLRVRINGDERLFSALLTSLVRAEVPVSGFQEEVSDLEDIFLRITRGLVQ
jgi:ABC-2 type transport system ATP-binding protein